MSNDPLFSFAILSYNNYKYIKEALRSLLDQDYPNIELIISNDGSADFNQSDLIQYLNENRRANIRKIVINNNVTNLGTVKNVEYCRKAASGEFIMFMAADDSLFDNTVLTRLVNEFNTLGQEALCVCSKVAMCSHELSEINGYFPMEEGIDAIKNLDLLSLFSRLSHTFTIPTTSTCYRKTLFDQLGAFDEKYFIIEDAPYFLKMAREGIKFHWIDDLVAARHRDGGISHGNKLKISESYRRYRYDEILLYENEILPYRNLIEQEDLIKMEKRWKWLNTRYYINFIYPTLPFKDKTIYIIKNLPYFLKQIIYKLLLMKFWWKK